MSHLPARRLVADERTLQPTSTVEVERHDTNRPRSQFAWCGVCGEASDLSAVALDMAGGPLFHRRVYEIARTIPPGATLSYGAIAARLGAPGSARAVGQALGHNPFAIVVPCHRVLAADGKLGGFSAHGGSTTKHRLLAIEGAPTNATLALFDDVRSTSPHEACEQKKGTIP